MEHAIEVQGLTKDYGSNRGNFDVNITVARGMCHGYLGPNGAGKTTTIRHLMGFSKPDSGTCTIEGIDCWSGHAQLQQRIGYLPGEISFPHSMKAKDFLGLMARLRGVRNRENEERLLERFGLDAAMPISQLSLGDQRKLAVVTAFAHDPAILILDEPTSGLDPVMQQRFIDFIVEEKKRGKTILLSSHIFHEVDAACDEISIIRQGRIVDVVDPQAIRNREERIYEATFASAEAYGAFVESWPTVSQRSDSRLSASIVVKKGNIGDLVHRLAELGVTNFDEKPFSLEDYFMRFYEAEEEHDERSGHPGRWYYQRLRSWTRDLRRIVPCNAWRNLRLYRHERIGQDDDAPFGHGVHPP